MKALIHVCTHLTLIGFLSLHAKGAIASRVCEVCSHAASQSRRVFLHQAPHDLVWFGSRSLTRRAWLDANVPEILDTDIK